MHYDRIFKKFTVKLVRYYEIITLPPKLQNNELSRLFLFLSLLKHYEPTTIDWNTSLWTAKWNYM